MNWADFVDELRRDAMLRQIAAHASPGILLRARSVAKDSRATREPGKAAAA